MAVATEAFFLQIPGDESLSTGGVISDVHQLAPEGPPSILWGQGTPNGDLPPFNQVNKGSLYLSVNQTDDTAAMVFVKVDEGGDDADWEEVFVDGGQALISTGDLATAAGIKVEQLEANAVQVIAPWGDLFDISAADSEQVVFHAVASVEIDEIGILWEEATGASGAAEGDVTIGTATGGAQIVAATAYDVSQASGAYQALTIVEGTLAAGDSVFVSHDQAAGASGTYRVIAKYRNLS